ncbi:NAD(P) transhydrogenase subunit alpha [Kutzneria viridogrisea]|uniref:proton-translocating NAD(P)(+) transhydrogenase n=1 Tax=Kutzneria viridogrisea TaxID=47990 RepID=A0ABR6BDL8_9PSEU|nr:NAD(P) transhydrogenase subunit alpha [Kutzneria viridogrisea]
MRAELTVAVLRETAPGERRVALVPEGVRALTDAGARVLVENAAGELAHHPDSSYTEAGAEVVPRETALAQAGILLVLHCPLPTGLRKGQVLIGLLAGADLPALAERGVTAIGLEGLPRKLSRAQSMDALSSQDNVAGYKAVLVAAQVYPRYLPMLITAAGTAPPARVLVLGVGVAGLQAIGTARRLGAVVTAYDIRPETAEEVRSLGASFLELATAIAGSGQGGYARALTAEEEQAQRHELDAHIARHDIVITTARVPGRKPPLLVTEQAVKAMVSGSVVVDLAAGPLGGNVELSEPGVTRVTENGVTVIGAEGLAATVPSAASAAYSRNLLALLRHLLHEGELRIDLTDEIQAGVVRTHDGRETGA